MSQYKTLRHKTLPNVYAYPSDMPIEFSHIGTPQLFPATCTIEGLKKYYKDHPKALQQLEEEYDLIDVAVTPLKLPAKVIFWPNGVVSVRDEEGNDMPELQAGWMTLFFEYLANKNIEPSNIIFKAFINQSWCHIKPNLTSDGWNYIIDKQEP